MNYLARHLQNAHGVPTKAEAFVEAAGYNQEVEEVTAEERQEYRDHTAEVAASRLVRKNEKAIQQQQQQQKKPQDRQQQSTQMKRDRPFEGSTADSSTGGKRQRLVVPEPGPARTQLQEYLIKKTPQLRHFANMARKFADGADDFAEVCETVVGMLASPGAS